MIKKIFFFLLTTFSFSGLKAQDIHFTQFNVNPMLLNPANVGFINCDYRLTAQYKNQWRSITVPFVTYASSAELRLMKGAGQRNALGFGLLMDNDRAGDSKLSQTQVGFDAAYTKSLDPFGIQYFGLGVLGSINLLQMDRAGVTFDDQFNLNTTYITPASAEIFNQNTSFFDVSAGAQYYYTPDKSHSFNAGFAMYHIPQPARSFTGDASSVLKRKFVFNLSGMTKISNKMELYPKLQISLQDPHREVVFGSFLRMDLDKKISNSKYGAYFGAWYRLGDAISPVIRIDIDKLSFGMSYDITMSKLIRLSDARSGPEFSIIYVGCIQGVKKTQMFCPRF